MPSRRLGDRHDQVERFSRQVEADYDVSLTWEYSPRGEQNGKARALATLKAEPLAWSDLPVGRWFVSLEIIQTSTGAREVSAHLLAVSKIMVDLQMARSYGVSECEHFVPLVK